MRHLGLLLCFVVLAGCHTDMWAEPQTRALEPNATFPDGQSARTFPAGTVAFSEKNPSTPFESGLIDGQPIQTVPVQQTLSTLKLQSLKQLLEHGRVRFDVFCSPCHGRMGDGNGMIAQRGLELIRKPRNFYEPRILNAPDGHIFRVITYGYGAMFSYGDRIQPADRWSIIAYIRALELSEGAKWGSNAK